jgi:arabinogalactan oligomer / maltooligosaccharide transport system permease protein
MVFGSVACLEVLLYGLLYKFRSKFFWPGLLALVLLWFGASLLIYGDAKGEEYLQSLIYPIFGMGLLGFYFQKIHRGRYRFPIMMIAPALISVILLIIYPFFFELKLSFAKLNLYSIAKWIRTGELSYVGFENYLNVFTSTPLQTATFWQLLLRTLIWTGVNLVFHVGFGLFLAMLLNRSLRGKGFYRMLLIIPWAMPQVVAILAWRGEFHPQFGFINHALSAIGLSAINWWSDPVPVFASCLIVNIWLGIPFMMIVFLGGLQSIPKSLYEAASLDGASKIVQFFQVTLPMLKPVVIPSVTLGTIWTFNNINVIYLMTGQDGGNEYADILVSALYKSAFTYSRYSFSAAFAMVIFAILLLLTIIWMKISKGTESPAL